MESRKASFAKLRGFFYSISDNLRLAGFEDVATGIDKFYDLYDARRGKIYGDPRFVKINEQLDKLNRKDMEQVLSQFRRYQAANQNNRKQTAQAIRNRGGLVAEMIDATEWMYAETGQEARYIGVQVWDPKLGQWRPMGQIKPQNMWSRVVREEVADILHHAGPDANLQLWEQMVDALMADGHIKSRDEAWEYVTNYFSPTTIQDYFAGVERARGRAMPEIFYDYNWDVVVNYVESWARRVSQVDAFNQKTTPDTMELFEEALKRTRDRRTQIYLNEARKLVYLERDVNDFTAAMANMNMLATGLQLANPYTAFRNLGTGLLYNYANYGAKPAILALASMAKDAKAAWRDGKHVGVLKEDLLLIARDSVAQGGSEMLAAFTSGAMKWGGYTITEQQIRVHAMLSGRVFLLDALKTINKKPNGRSAKQYAAFFQRHNIDVQRLLIEQGTGEETNRALRLMVNIPQGSYRPDMVPAYVDSPMGRFLFKYQKYGTQRNREFWQNGLRPFVVGEKVSFKDAQGAEHSGHVRNFQHLLRYLLVGGVAGAPLAKMIELLFGTAMRGPDLDELEKALENKSRRDQLGVLASMAWHSMMTLGAAGFFGNYMQFASDIADRQRFKNPMSPPGIAPIEALLSLGLRWHDQGTLTARDIDQALSQAFSGYRAYKRIGITTLNWSGVLEAVEDTTLDNFGAVSAVQRETALENAMRDKSYVRKMTRRYAAETGLAAKRRSPGGIFSGTVNTPTARRVVEELMLGNPEAARAIAREWLLDLDAHPDPRAVDQAWAALTGSVRAQDPARIAVVPSDFERVRFLRWVKDAVGDENYQRVRRVSDGYRSSAVQAGMMKPENEIAADIEAMKREIRADVFSDPSMREMYVDRLIGWRF